MPGGRLRFEDFYQLLHAVSGNFHSDLSMSKKVMVMVDFQHRKLMDYPEVRITMMIESTAESTSLRKVFNISIFGGLFF